MKHLVLTIALISGLQLSLTASAQQHDQITLRVPGFVRPLIEKWAGEYQKKNPQVDFQFDGGKSQDNADNTISISTDAASGVTFARYAVLPVTTRQSQADKLIGQRRLSVHRLKSLFFTDDELDEDDDEQDEKTGQLHIITGNSQQSASRLFAAHFHEATSNYKGKRISGDDTFLNLAISRDPLGVTVNSLSNIFDLESRQLRPTLALLPLDIDKQGRQILAEGRLDQLLQLLERETYAEIPVGRLAFAYNRNNALLNGFVHWLLVDGTRYVHEYGLLELPAKELTAMQQLTAQKDLAQK